MLQFTIDAAPAVQTPDTCQTCCCDVIQMRPGTTEKIAIDYTMWVANVGRLHCVPQFQLEQQATCGVSGGANLPPQPAPQVAFTTAINTVLNGDLGTLVTDPEGDPLTFKLVYWPYGLQKGSVAIDPSGTFVYTPLANAQGIDRFYASVSDGINAAVVFEAIVGVGQPITNVANTPHVSVLQDGVQINYNYNRVSFPLQVTPAAQLCEVWRLNVYQGAIDCENVCYNRVDCYDIRLAKC
jgi:hypothetical protein